MNKTIKSGLQVGLPAVLLSISTGAMAHPGHETVMGFISGLSHPIMGLDHLVAMIALGFVAVKLNARRLTLTCFGSGMILGGMLAFAGVNIPFVEAIIVASLLAITFTLLNRSITKTRLVYTVPALLAFSASHGWAHVAEQPVDFSSAWYMTGMMVSALSLQVIGLFLAQRLEKKLVARKTVAGATLTTAALAAGSLILG